MDRSTTFANNLTGTRGTRSSLLSAMPVLLLGEDTIQPREFLPGRHQLTSNFQLNTYLVAIIQDPDLVGVTSLEMGLYGSSEIQTR